MDTSINITWTDFIGQTYESICPFLHGFFFQCPQATFEAAELLIGANFTTALALKNVTSLEKDITRDMVYLTVQLQYGVADDPFPLYPRPFPLFPNVHIRATLAMTHLQSIKNENIASLGLQKVGRDTRIIFQCR